MSFQQSAASINVEVVPHNLEWRSAFDQEATQIAIAIADNLVKIHHIGSTAIPNIYAKPIIDFLIEVKSIHRMDDQCAAMEALGYEAMGEFGLPGRRYFRKNSAPEIRTHNVHIYQVGSTEITRHLAFRDYMIAHPEAAQQYSDLKRTLAKKYPRDIHAYMDGKDQWIKEMEQIALAWQLRSCP